MAAGSSAAYAPAWFVMLAAVPALIALRSRRVTARRRHRSCSGPADGRGRALVQSRAVSIATRCGACRSAPMRAGWGSSCAVLLLGATSALVFVSRGRLWLLPALVIHGIVLDFVFCACTRPCTAPLSRAAASTTPSPGSRARCSCCRRSSSGRFTSRITASRKTRRAIPSSLGRRLRRVGLICGMSPASPTGPSDSRARCGTRSPAGSREPFVAEGKRALIVREARVLWAVYAAILAASLIFRSEAALSTGSCR